DRLPEGRFRTVDIAGRKQQFPARTKQLCDVAAFERPFLMFEAGGHRLEPFVDPPREPEQIAERSQKGGTHESAADRLLHGQAVLEQIDAFADLPARRKRGALERAAPFPFLQELVLTAER